MEDILMLAILIISFLSLELFVYWIDKKTSSN